MAGFYNSIFNPGAGSPSAFTSPGMNPQALQQLLQMQGGVGGGGMQPGVGMMPQQPPQGPGMPQVMGSQQGMQPPQGAPGGMTPQGLQAAIAAMKNGGGMSGSMDMGRMQQIHDLLTKMQAARGNGSISMQPLGMQRPAMPPVPGMFGGQGT